MKKKLNNLIITAEELMKQIHDENLVVVDARWSLDPCISYKKDYLKSHIIKSIFLDLNMFFKKNTQTPHMLTDEQNFKKLVCEMGIKNKHKIVIYDEKGFFNSARVWFMFKVFGHENTVILDGGFSSWIKKGFPTEDKVNTYEKSNFKTYFKNKLIITKQELSKLLREKKEFILIDARPQRRFQKLDSEPRSGIKKGNIESSINIPFTEIYDENHSLLKPEDLKKKLFFNDKVINKKIVVMCGSGITACNILFALNSISHTNNFLYDGSWAEWGKENKEI